MRRAAFTLIEIMIVVAVMGLLTAAAVWSFAGPVRAAQLRDTIETIRVADANARRAARNFDRPETLEFKLPGNATIDETRIRGSQPSFQQRPIEISPLGLSPTYAVRVVCGDETRWLVFAGLSGQMTVVNEESQLQRFIND